MAISVECPACEHVYSVPDRFGGKNGKCPECGNTFLAPTSGSASGPPVPSSDSFPPPPLPLASVQNSTVGGLKIPAPRNVAQRVATPVHESTPVDSAPEPSFLALSEATNTTTITPNSEPAARLRASASKSNLIAAMSVLVVVLVGCGILFVLVNPFGSTSNESNGQGSSHPPKIAAQDTDTDPEDLGKDAPATELLMPEEMDQLWEKVYPFIFRIEVETPTETRFGSGFMIDTRGWVATSCHLVADAKSLRVHPATGADNVERPPINSLGVVAKQPQFDLAIVALDLSASANFVELPLHVATKLDSDEKLVATGFPVDTDGWLSPCLAKQMVSNSELPPKPRQVLHDLNLNTPDELIWIEHTATIDDQAVGGPLLNLKGAAVGVNMQLTTADNRGYAIPIRHLAELKSMAGGTVTPFVTPAVAKVDRPLVDPMPKPMPPVKKPMVTKSAPGSFDSVGVIKKLHAECQAMKWSPASDSAYGKLQDLAEYVAAAQFKMDETRVDERIRVILDTAAQEVLEDLNTTQWRDDEALTELNQLAMAGLKKSGRGVFAYVEVAHAARRSPKIDDQPTVVLKLIGTDQLLILPVRENSRELKKGTRALFLGAHVPDSKMDVPAIKTGAALGVAELVRAKTLLLEPEPVIDK